jgi:SAM-dependent methyltransferase
MADDYKDLKGYNPEADLGLGCGLPTQFAKIKKGDVVIDLGSGAGNDCFIARSETGETGKVIGIDMTEAMINRARVNTEKLNYHNIEFRLGEIEFLPVSNNTADVIVSNCVLNLVPDKRKAFQEIHRVLKPGGHFSISDIVLTGKLPEKVMQTAELYAGCVSGGIPKDEYMSIIKELGFENITIQKEKRVTVPDDVLANYLSADEINQYKESGAGVFSITVYADKKKDECCDKTTCCK